MVAWVVEAWGQVEAWLLALVDSVWALPVLFATTAGDGFFPPIPGETVIVMLAVGAQSGGGVAWGLVLLVAALGAWCGDQLAYALGRALGTRALPALRGPRGRRAVAWATRSLDRRGASGLLRARYVAVGRTAASVTAGAAGFSRRRFVALSAGASVAARPWCSGRGSCPSGARRSTSPRARWASRGAGSWRCRPWRPSRGRPTRCSSAPWPRRGWATARCSRSSSGSSGASSWASSSTPSSACAQRVASARRRRPSWSRRRRSVGPRPRSPRAPTPRGSGPTGPPPRGVASGDAEQVDDEDQRLAREAVAGARRAVRQVRRHDELAAPADLHAGDALLPARDEAAQREVDRLPAVPRGVELLARLVLDAEVVHVHGRAGRGLGAVADGDVLDDELGGGGALGRVDLG